MKYLSFLLGILFFAFLSCNKNENEVKEIGCRNSTDVTENSILDFIDRIKLIRDDPEQELFSACLYSTDSTIYYLESCINYDFSYPNLEPNEIIKDSMFIEISVDHDNKFNLQNLQLKYDMILDSLECMYANIEAEHKNLITINLELINSSSNSIEIKLIAFWNKGGRILSLPDGDWHIYNGGMCNGSYSTYSSEKKMMHELFNYCIIHNQGVFFTNIVVESSEYYESFTQTSPFNYYPFLPDWLYAESWAIGAPQPSGGCIPLSHMNKYIENLKLLTDLRENDLNKKAFVHLIEWDFWNFPTTVDHFDYTDWAFGEPHPKTYQTIPTFMQ